MGGSVGGSKSKSKSNTSQDVWGPQGDALKRLYDQAGNLFDQYDSSPLDQKAGELDPYNKQLMERGLAGQEQQMGGGAYGDPSVIRNQLLDSMKGGQSNVGKMYESIVGGAGNTYIDPMVDAMKNSSMENLQRMQSGTAMDAAALGQGGSSRHAMQNAMQSRDMNQDMLDREMQMRGGAYDTDLGMKMDIARQADSGAQMDRDRLYNMLGGANQSMQTGAGMGSGLQNLGMGSMAPWMQSQNQPWDVATKYANVLGRPTVLGSGSMSGKSTGVGSSGSLKGK